MKRLIKKALSYDEVTVINDIKFEYTMDPGDCSICNEHIFSDDGAYYATKDGKTTYICMDCAEEVEKESEEVKNLM